MTKKIICILLTLFTLSLSVLSCTHEPINNPDSTGTSESESIVGTEDDTVFGEITTEKNEPETEDPNEELRKKQEEMKEIYDATEEKLLPIGGWSTPTGNLRDDITGNEGGFDAIFKSIASTGINYMATLEEWSSGSGIWPLDALSSAKKAGLKLWYNCSGQETKWNIERINKLLESDSADALAAIYIKDEPTIDEMDMTANLTREMREALGEKNKLPVFSNLLPTYAPTSSTGNYAEYVKTYIEKTSPDILMFDFYPYGGAGDTLPAMISNIAVAKMAADKAKIPLYTFIQSSGWGGMREPNQSELLLDVNLNLAMGVKGINYFLICEQEKGWGFSSMISYEGKINSALFKKIQSVNENILAMKGVYLGYNNKGVILSNYDKAKTQLEKNAPEMLIENFASLTSVSSAKEKKVLIGCFENDEKKEALYVVNAEYSSKNNITLNFDSEVSYKIWSDNGLEDMGKSNIIELSLDRGQGVFVTFD